ncbi:MAG: hypothetical protein ACPG5B_07410 [Chitinophagales bacterium]
MKKHIINKKIFLFVFGFIFFFACSNENANTQQETTTKSSANKTSLEELSTERLKELREAAKDSKNINLSDVFVKRGVELAAKYCKCGEQKDIQAQKNCRSRLEQTYRTIDNRLVDARKASFSKAYNNGKKACK